MLATPEEINILQTGFDEKASAKHDINRAGFTICRSYSNVFVMEFAVSVKNEVAGAMQGRVECVHS